VYILTLLPFISNPVFQKAVLGSDINARFFIAQISLGFSESIQIVPILLITLLFLLYSKKPSTDQSTTIGYQSFAIMAANLILLGYSHFHPQWFTWIIPFWIFWIVTLEYKHQLGAALLSLLSFGAWLIIVILFKDKSLSIGLLIPINPSLANLPILSEYLFLKGVKVQDYTNYAHSWLAAMGTLTLVGAGVYYKEITTSVFAKIPHPYSDAARSQRVCRSFAHFRARLLGSRRDF
jgi:hypothetical protein